MWINFILDCKKHYLTTRNNINWFFMQISYLTISWIGFRESYGNPNFIIRAMSYRLYVWILQEWKDFKIKEWNYVRKLTNCQLNYLHIKKWQYKNLWFKKIQHFTYPLTWRSKRLWLYQTSCWRFVAFWFSSSKIPNLKTFSKILVTFTVWAIL